MTLPATEELAEWRRLCEEATPGPWESWAEAKKTQAAKDAAFIATARTALPRLIDAVEEWKDLARRNAEHIRILEGVKDEDNAKIAKLEAVAEAARETYQNHINTGKLYWRPLFDALRGLAKLDEGGE